MSDFPSRYGGSKGDIVRFKKGSKAASIWRNGAVEVLRDLEYRVLGFLSYTGNDTVDVVCDEMCACNDGPMRAKAADYDIPKGELCLNCHAVIKDNRAIMEYFFESPTGVFIRNATKEELESISKQFKEQFIEWFKSNAALGTEVKNDKR
jgi:hypothetical protein